MKQNESDNFDKEPPKNSFSWLYGGGVIRIAKNGFVTLRNASL